MPRRSVLEAARRALDAAIRAAFEDAELAPAPVDVACLGLAGFDRPDDRRILAGWAEEARWADRLVIGQRRRSCDRGRHAGGLGYRSDCGHRVDCRGPNTGRTHRTRRRLGALDRR